MKSVFGGFRLQAPAIMADAFISNTMYFGDFVPLAYSSSQWKRLLIVVAAKVTIESAKFYSAYCCNSKSSSHCGVSDRKFQMRRYACKMQRSCKHVSCSNVTYRLSIVILLIQEVIGRLNSDMNNIVFILKHS